MMMSFDGYSFCKPHSASYARVSFQAAWLKTHYPAEFMAAVISNQGGYYSTFAYVSEAKRLGLQILPPCVNHSRIRWHGRDRGLRVGLMALKGLARSVRDRILACRKKASFGSAMDFWQRVQPPMAQARLLIQAGALDSLSQDGNRARLFWELSQFSCFSKGRKNSPLFQVTLPPPPLLAEPEKKRCCARNTAPSAFSVRSIPCCSAGQGCKVACGPVSFQHTGAGGSALLAGCSVASWSRPRAAKSWNS